MCNALVWGVSWWPFRQLQAQGVHPLWATALVYAFATASLLLWRPFAWRGMAAHPGLWLLMLASGLTNVGFNWAVTTGDVLRVVRLFYLMPAWSVVLAWWLLGERPHARALGRLTLAAAGVLLVLKTPESAWPVPSPGFAASPGCVSRSSAGWDSGLPRRRVIPSEPFSPRVSR